MTLSIILLPKIKLEFLSVTKCLFFPLSKVAVGRQKLNIRIMINTFKLMKKYLNKLVRNYIIQFLNNSSFE